MAEDQKVPPSREQQLEWAVKFYAERHHYNEDLALEAQSPVDPTEDDDEMEAPDEPNWLEHTCKVKHHHVIMVEDGSCARAALAGKLMGDPTAEEDA